MSKERKKYTEDYKKHAVALSYSSSQTLRETAASLNENINIARNASLSMFPGIFY
ncbi:MAG: hypothetical protein ACOX1U_03970 [Saccharofermentanales bacterium]